MNNEIKRCRTCYFWKHKSECTNYGECSIQTNKAEIESRLRFAYSKGNVEILVPRWGLCDLFESKEQKNNKEHDNNNKRKKN